MLSESGLWGAVSPQSICDGVCGCPDMKAAPRVRRPWSTDRDVWEPSIGTAPRTLGSEGMSFLRFNHFGGCRSGIVAVTKARSFAAQYPDSRSHVK